jgi:xanthine/CO dehydrogenase XdhC/CoxF family maturation factor
MTEIARILAALAAAPGQAAALSTLVQVEGSSYRRPGARLLLCADGTRLGSISGGCLEDDIVLRAQRVLESGRPELATYDTTAENDLVWGVGLGCQGVVLVFIERLPSIRPRWVGVLAENLRARRTTRLAVVHGGENPPGTGLAGDSAAAPGAAVFRETISAPPAVLILGAGDDAQPLVRMAKETGWHVTVADSRAVYATAARFPGADAVISAPATGIVRLAAPDERTSVVVMTHRYADDLELLRTLLVRPLAYVGLLGPRQRTDRLLAQLQAEGVVADDETLARLHAPVGLDLGGITPETVALSILAELQACRAGRIPVHLRDRRAPIHG